jgi:hypothetical protein
MIKASVQTQEKRSRLIIQEIIEWLSLDLSDITVLTEMASRAYVYTPLIAALAGAPKVLVVVKNSRHGQRDEIVQRGLGLAEEWGVSDRVEILEALSPSAISQADVVTNLGFVRPIDAEFISHLKPGAVIPYMREAWEIRSEDVDLAACRERNIPVLGTNEDYDDLKIFDYCGPLAFKLLLEAGIEVKGCNILVVSGDRFGDSIAPYLQSCGAHVTHVRVQEEIDLDRYRRLDAILIAHFTTNELIVGRDGWITPEALIRSAPECSVIRFVGEVDVGSLLERGISCVPEHSVGTRRMTKTFAELGPKPVIDLHAAGFKVGELMWREMQILGDAEQVEKILVVKNHLGQRMP